ncbi:hypothetical protein [Numidum massiliense]|uniref:hypothetical protein n=1 Tax=Numidum massiliense TaxID=1522315 RepID=UPI0006D585F1|nr:hypothetical protein [Numidum massiliense]
MEGKLSWKQIAFYCTAFINTMILALIIAKSTVVIPPSAETPEADSKPTSDSALLRDSAFDAGFHNDSVTNTSDPNAAPGTNPTFDANFKAGEESSVNTHLVYEYTLDNVSYTDGWRIEHYQQYELTVNAKGHVLKKRPTEQTENLKYWVGE